MAREVPNSDRRLMTLRLKKGSLQNLLVGRFCELGALMTNNNDDNTIEDDIPLEKLLEKVDNKYKIVMIAAKRARQLNDGSRAMIKMKGKHSAIALGEILEGKLEVTEQQMKKKGTQSEPNLSGINFSGGKDKDDEDSE